MEYEAPYFIYCIYLFFFYFMKQSNGRLYRPVCGKRWNDFLRRICLSVKKERRKRCCTARHVADLASVVAKVNLSRKNDDKIKYEWGISEGTALDPARARPSKFAKITPICTQIQ